MSPIVYTRLNSLIAVARGERRDRFAEQLIAEFKAVDAPAHYIDDTGAMRWRSNNQVPPLDITELAHFLGALTDAQFVASIAARDAETAEVFRRYRDDRRKHGFSEDELCEMRAAHGPGQVLVDIVTGQRFKT